MNENPSCDPQTTAVALADRARELFERARQANDPDARDILSAAAWYYADKVEGRKISMEIEFRDGSRKVISHPRDIPRGVPFRVVGANSDYKVVEKL